MSGPYHIEGPALISFSGGRTSAYMLRMILDAHGGTLPPDVHVCFANTGKEREETLRFVHECATRWGVRVRWLEWRSRERGGPWEDGFTEVGYNSAARKGEPFKALCARYDRLPNAFTRFCSGKLKIQVMRDFMRAHGFDHWTSVIGLRADEMLRVFKAIERNEGGRERWVEAMPLVAAKVRECTVLGFWGEQPFDLGLEPGEGNCDLCFLKTAARLKASIRRDPQSVQWWQGMEESAGASFVQGRTYARLAADVLASPLLPLEPDDEGEEFDAECGLWCAGEAA